MSIYGALRIKNEARWIDRVIRSIQPVCKDIIVFDDHSDDGTPEICEQLTPLVYRSHENGIDEARDKNVLLALVGKRAQPSDWILMIDGDEMLSPASVPVIEAAIENPEAFCFALQVLYLWDTEDQIRVDGIYSRFFRPSLFRSTEAPFQPRGACGFHCGNAPYERQRATRHLEGASLLHLGYLHREDRLRKYDWYNKQDPANRLEDSYRHMVIGDTFPASSVFVHAGPLKLAQL